ncbi:MAG: methyltransferase domain-containing protein, partial [Chloroflexota bacterium]|nr:methyltransferase domain-containing protein [Chloroflexota bacterium]
GRGGAQPPRPSEALRLPGELAFRFAGPWPRLLTLRTVMAVHAVAAAGAPRPAALLDDGTLKQLLATVGHVRSLHPGGAFRTFRLSAAGADSPVFQRLRERIARDTGLADVVDGGDLLLRVRRAPDGTGFELTARISPRPLAARSWRRCNLPGALNATVAAVMADLTEPAPDDVYLNFACGSGTLLVERALAGPARRLVGCDVDPGALACAAENATAAGLTDTELHAWDATVLPLADAGLDALTVDLPFGQLVGSHTTNEQLYPRLLAEAARVAKSGARLVAITQQFRLLEQSARELRDAWSVERTIRLTIPTNAAPISPRVYVLRRA